LTADDDALELIASYSSGDCRNAYNTLEVAAQLAHEGSGERKAHRQRHWPVTPCSSAC
jgi:replication-associated recombination protein RarA